MTPRVIVVTHYTCLYTVLTVITEVMRWGGNEIREEMKFGGNEVMGN